MNYDEIYNNQSIKSKGQPLKPGDNKRWVYLNTETQNPYHSMNWTLFGSGI
jgi:hypothetical protein